jgi:hypothetical protein
MIISPGPNSEILTAFLSQFPTKLLSRFLQIWIDSENKTALVFLPGRVLSQDELLCSHMLKVKLFSYYSCCHMIGAEDATYHGSTI